MSDKPKPPKENFNKIVSINDSFNKMSIVNDPDLQRSFNKPSIIPASNKKNSNSNDSNQSSNKK